MHSPTRPSPASFLKHATEVASFYGFRPLREIERTVPNLERRVPSFASAANACVQSVLLRPEEPALAYWGCPSPLHLTGLAAENPREAGEFGLNIVGVPESIAEIVLLKAVSTVIADWGAPIARVRLNALGDRDSKARFEREVSVYLRKHVAHLHEECREKLNREPMAPYSCKTELCRGVVEGGPRAMNFLSEKSRAHFKEVLEHLEKLSLPYEFDDLLMSDGRECRMLFHFDIDGEDATVLSAAGGRFDDHFRTYSPRTNKEVAGVSASIFFRKKGISADTFKLTAPATPNAVYFVQLGLRAKLEGLNVVDVLRAAGIPVLQSFDSAKLTPQLSAAKAAGVSHLVIMGAREALDGTVLVRSMADSSQAIVGLTELPRYLKTLR
jgi:histidyl-tRNA synthetase